MEYLGGGSALDLVSIMSEACALRLFLVLKVIVYIFPFLSLSSMKNRSNSLL